MEIDPIRDWLSKHGTTVLICITCTLVLFPILYRWSAGSAEHAKNDYLQAEVSFKQLEQELLTNNEINYHELTEILERRPELQQKYDAPLAQLLLIRGNNDEAAHFGKRALERLEGSPFTQYALNSLQITDSEY